MNTTNQNASMELNEKVLQSYFAWDFSGEVAVWGEFEMAGVLRGGVDNVNVPRLPTASDSSPAGRTDGT